MPLLDARLRPVNSKSYTLAKGYTRAMIDAEKKCAGILTYDPAGGAGTAPGKCLAGYPMTGSAVLVDYNYVMTCAHCFDSLLQAVGTGAMARGKVWVVFNNEITAATADSPIKEKEPSRPYANLRGDLEAWGGNSCGLDYMLVKIEWKDNGFALINRLPILPDPNTFHDSQLQGKPLLFIGQYTHDSSIFPPTMSTHVAMSDCTNTGVSHTWDGCDGDSPAAYGELALGVGLMGPSGSGIYDLVRGQVRLVGIFGKGFRSMKYFVPLDRIYADKVTGFGTAKPSGTVGDLMRRIYAQRTKDGMPQL